MLTVALGLACASLAHGATKYVSPTGTFTWLSASSPLTPCSIDTANARARAGDVVVVGAGTYAGKAPNVQSSGTVGSRITYYGSATDTAAAVFTGGLSLGSRSYITLKWMKISGSVSLNGGATSAVGDSLHGMTLCASQSLTLDIGGADSTTISNCIIGAGTWRMNRDIRTPINQLYGFKMNNCWFPSLTATNSKNAFIWGMVDGTIDPVSATVGVTVLNTRFDIAQSGSTAYAIGKIHGPMHHLYQGCRWNVTSTMTGIGENEGSHGYVLRDSAHAIAFVRDTFVTVSPSFQLASILTSSGTKVFVRGVSVDSCRFISSNSGDLGIIYNQMNTSNFRLTNSVLYTRNGIGLKSIDGDSVTIKHNTILSSGTGDIGHAIVLSPAEMTAGKSDVSSNIFVTVSGDKCPVRGMDTAISSSIMSFNAGMIYGSTTTSLVRNNSSTCAADTAKLRYRDPMFADSSMATLDVTPSTSSTVAYWSGWPDGYVGAINPYSAPTDETPPSDISDLAVDGTTSSSIGLTWSEVGDDGLTGAVTRYEVRYSTANITSANWASATVFASPPAPVWNSQPITVTVTGLSASTTYYLAVKAFDDEGNESGLSNVVHDATTAAADVTAPATISDLATSLPTSSTIFLTWTAPGDDGSTGTATSYQGRYATSAITNSTQWNAATPISSMPTPGLAGTTQSVSVSGLSASTTYYFAVRATDDASNQGGISNSPSGTTGAVADVTAPAAITTLSAPSVTSTSVTLTWIAVGDDGSTGTATAYKVRYTTVGPITNETAWAAATTCTGCELVTPSASGSVEGVTVGALTGGTTYYFNVRAVDEANNIGGLSTSASRTTLPAPDVTRPAQPTVVAKAHPSYADGAMLTFTAVGDDSLTGQATSYEVRYRANAGVTLSNWNTVSVASVNFAPSVSETPRASGQADTVVVRGLAPGNTYWFSLRAIDDAGNPSAIATPDSASIPARQVSDLPQPAPFLYSGAYSSSPPNFYPYLSIDGASIDTAVCRQASRFVGMSINPDFVDSTGGGVYGRRVSLRALQIIKSMNPGFIVLAEPGMHAAYFRQNADTLGGGNGMAYYAEQWNAVRDAGGGWTTGTGAPFGSFTPGGYTDSTGSRGFLWTTKPGYRGWFFSTYSSGITDGASAAGHPGYTTVNVNIAYQPSAGVFPVADSLADVAIRQFLLRKHPDGTWVYDGIRWDLSTQSFTNAHSAGNGDTIDVVRAGYSTHLAFDSAWTMAAARMMTRLRQYAVNIGRPDFIVVGNGGYGLITDHMNGWMTESFPSLNGGSWYSNLLAVPGGMLTDAQRMAWRPHAGAIFTFMCEGYQCVRGSDTTSTARKLLRYGLGSAAIAGSWHAMEPEYASGAKDTLQGYWFDEYSVDTLTSQSRWTQEGTGWMGYATSSVPYVTAPTIYSGGDRLLGNGGFEYASLSSGWTATLSGTSGQAAIDMVTDTVATGSKAVRLRVGTRQSNDWRVTLASLRSGYATSGQAIVLTFKARADRPRHLQALVIKSDGNNNASWTDGNAAHVRTWVGTTWQTYRMVGTAVTTDSIRAAFWAGDTTGTVWLDDVTLHVGGSRGGSFVREYRRGVVVVNPQSYADTVTFGRATRRITSLTGRPASVVNTGELLAAGSSIIVPAGDARFLIFPVDTLRPNTVANLLAKSAFTDRATLTWTTPGDDSTSGTALSYQIRMALTAISSESDWNAATSVTPRSPKAGGAADTLVVTGLSPSTTYYFALRTYDDAGYFSAISNSDSTRTLPVGSAPTAAFALSAYSGAEPLTIVATDASTGSPNAWEWVVERVRDGADPQISSEQNPTFVLSDSGTYAVRLQVSNDFGTDTTVALVTLTCTPPEQITSLAGEPLSTTQATLKWVEPGDDGGTGSAAAFDVRYLKGSSLSEGTWASATQVTSGVPAPTYAGQPTGCVVSGLTVGETYTFGVKARDENGCWGTLSNVVTITTPGAIERTVSVPLGEINVRVTVERKR